MTDRHEGAREGARSEILERLRRNLSLRSDLFMSGPARREVPPIPSPVAEAFGDKWVLAREFAAKLEALHGSAQIEERPADVLDAVVRLVKRLNEPGDAVLAWDATELPVPGLESRLREEGISLFVPDDMYGEVCRRRAGQMAVGITGVQAAFAGTGSFALVPSQGRSRAAALLPLHHVALIPISRVYPSIEAWIERLRNEDRLVDLVRGSSQLAFVTGPSKSADIELNLTLGVHGPKAVHAVVFDDEGHEA